MVDNPHLDNPYLDDLPGLGQRHRATRAPDRDFELSVLHLLERHGEAEGELLDAYSKVAERSSGKGAIEFLVQLILDDEYRHHQVFNEMANAIRSFLWEVPVEPSLPAMTVRSDPALLAETRRLLAFEKQDAKELRRLRKTLKHSPSSSLDPLMVELMLHDTAKHIAILEFVEAHLRE
jgi:hypothetical protein